MSQLRRPILILLIILKSSIAFAQGEEAVSLAPDGAPGQAAPSPYIVERNPYWVVLPLGFLLLISLHLIAYPYSRVKKQKVNLESKK